MEVSVHKFSVLFSILFFGSCVHKQEYSQRLVEDFLQDIQTELKKSSSISLSINCPKISNNKDINLFFGRTKKNENILPDKNTIYQIGSISKLYLAALILQQVELGSISLEDNLASFIENAPKNWENVKVKNLLNMTSGIPSHFGSINIHHVNNMKNFQINPYQLFDKNKIIDSIKTEELIFNPGENWDYSNVNYLIAGIILEKLTKKNLADLMHDNISKKLSFNNTFFINHNIKNEISDEKYNNLSEGYIDLGNYLNDINANNFTVSLAWGAGTILSNIVEMHSFIKAFFNKNSGLFRDEKTYDIYHDYFYEIASYNLKSYTEKTLYSFGVFTRKHSKTGLSEYFHSGGIFGFNSNFSIIPAKDVSYVVLSASMQGESFVKLNEKIEQFINDKCL